MIARSGLAALTFALAVLAGCSAPATVPAPNPTTTPPAVLTATGHEDQLERPPLRPPIPDPDHWTVDSWRAIIDNPPPPPPLERPAAPAPPPPHRVPVTPPAGVEGWRELVASHFPAGEVDRALTVIACESGGDPGIVNPSSGASGLFQHMPRYWPERSAAAGVPGADILDPVANVTVAAYLVAVDGWRHWNASAWCWN